MRKVIEDYLMDLISNDKKYLKEALPSENFLATKFKVSRQTARVELTRLLNKGFLVAVKGSGYYVNPHINSLKLTAIGNKFKFTRREVKEVGRDDLLRILAENDFIVVDNTDAFFGFQKIYYNQDNEPILYQTSYIYQPFFKNINLDLIKKSLMDTFEQNQINLNMQINKIEMVPLSEMDQMILKTNQSHTPTVCGLVISKENEVVEIFERKYVMDYFNVNYSKFY